MEVIHDRCAGLDVHKETVIGCLRMRERGQIRREVRRWVTTTAGLLELADWLRQAGCTYVAMEATGVYWKPVWHILEGEFELVLANPAHIRKVPGRTNDVNDATWIADLLAHSLIRASLVPPDPIQELRDLTSHAQAADARDRSAQATHSEGARRRQCKAGFRGFGCVRRERPPHA
jgi:transposase